MSIETIQLTNFKSYKSLEAGPFNPRINVVLGKNGRGKSNLLKSLLFLFSDKIQFNETEKSALVFSGISNYAREDLYVSIKLSDAHSTRKTLSNFNSNTMSLTRKWTAYGKEEFQIDDKGTSKTQLTSVIECLGITYSNPYNIVQQGKINQITQMSDHELYKLLEYSTGVRKYYKKRDEAVANLSKVKKEKEEISEILEEMDQKFSSLQHRKAEFQNYERMDRYKKLKAVQSFYAKLKDLKNILLGLREELKKTQVELMQNVRDSKLTKTEGEELKERAKELIAKIHFYQGEQLPSQAGGNMEMEFDHEQNRRYIRELERKKYELSAAIARDEGSLTRYKKDFELLKEKYEALKFEYELSKNKEREKMIQNSINSYVEEIRYNKETLEFSKNSLKQIEKMIHSDGSAKNSQTALYGQLSPRVKYLEELKTYMAKLKNVQRELKVKQIDANRKQNYLQIEHDALKATVQKNTQALARRISNLVNFELLAAIRKYGLAGVYGYVIDHLDISPDLCFAYDIASRNKFFSLLVEDHQVAKYVIRINKSIRGKALNLYTLYNLRRDALYKKTYPKSDSDVFVLINPEYLKVRTYHAGPADLKDLVTKLTNNILVKYVLVKDYPKALAVAKEYHLNCITGDREVVYSDAFLCRLGQYDTVEDSNISVYFKVKGKMDQFERLARHLLDCGAASDKLLSEEMNLNRQEKQLQGLIKECESKVQEIKSATYSQKNLQNEKAQLEKQIANMQEQIIKKEKLKAELEEKKKNVKKIEAPKDFLQIEKEYTKRSKEINEAMEHFYSLELSLKQTDELLKSKKYMVKVQEEDEQNSKMNSRMSPYYILRKLKLKLTEIEKSIQAGEEKYFALAERIEHGQSIQNYLQYKIAVYYQEYEQVQEKREYFGDDIEEDYEALQYLEREMSRTGGLPGRAVVYTPRDKLFFYKFGETLDRFTALSERYKEIVQDEKAVIYLLERYDVEAASTMENIIETFEKNFAYILKEIVPGTECEVRIKKHASRGGYKHDGPKFKNGLDIKVSLFGDVNRKWTELSGGQKTIIALAIVLAIQQCDPAPFYVFDEIDSALDPTYRARIAQLIYRFSEHAQYFITTFKPEFCSFPEPLCSYFEVTSRNRQSDLSTLEPEQARALVYRIYEASEATA